MDRPRVRLGNEVLLEQNLDRIRNLRIGLVTNHSGVTSDLTRTADVLRRCPGLQLAALLAPEHGITGEAENGTRIAPCIDRATGVPVFSLYGNAPEPTPDMLEEVGVLLFDIQDVGARFYTYISTLAFAMQGAAKHGTPFIVLDRPNPIGALLEGNLVETGWTSFVGIYPILLRHGMTVGELAQMFNGEFGIGAELTVVPMQGWSRTMLFGETGLSWVPPSPNMPTPDTALVYPGTCLLEGTNMSVGRGTAKPVEQSGAPFVMGDVLADALNARALPGVRFRPVCFVPGFGRYAGQRCEGVQLHITDRACFRPVRAALEIIVCLRTLYPDDFAWSTPARPGERYHFDLLAGTDRVRTAIESGASAADIVGAWSGEQEAFREMRAPYLLYQ
jgi:uncharacterized protein YbbC (DUF1343 family)